MGLESQLRVLYSFTPALESLNGVTPVPEYYSDTGSELAPMSIPPDWISQGDLQGYWEFAHYTTRNINLLALNTSDLPTAFDGTEDLVYVSSSHGYHEDPLSFSTFVVTGFKPATNIHPDNADLGITFFVWFEDVTDFLNFNQTPVNVSKDVIYLSITIDSTTTGPFDPASANDDSNGLLTWLIPIGASLQSGRETKDWDSALILHRSPSGSNYEIDTYTTDTDWVTISIPENSSDNGLGILLRAYQEANYSKNASVIVGYRETLPVDIETLVADQWSLWDTKQQQLIPEFNRNIDMTDRVATINVGTRTPFFQQWGYEKDIPTGTIDPNPMVITGATVSTVLEVAATTPTLTITVEGDFPEDHIGPIVQIAATVVTVGSYFIGSFTPFDGSKTTWTWADASMAGTMSSDLGNDIIADFGEEPPAGSPTLRKLYRHSFPNTGKGMGGKHTSPLIKVRK